MSLTWLGQANGGLRRHRSITSRSGVTLISVLILILILGLLVLWLSRSLREGSAERPPESGVEASLEATAGGGSGVSDGDAAHHQKITELQGEARELERRIQVAIDDLNARGESWEVDVEKLDQMFYDLETGLRMKMARAERQGLNLRREELRAEGHRVAVLRELALKLETDGDVNPSQEIGRVRRLSRN